MVQLPEPTSKGSAAQKAGYKTIAAIGKERIRRVAQGIGTKQKDKLPIEDDNPRDRGMRVFKLTPSTFRPWSGTADATPEEYTEEMELFTDPIAAGAGPVAVLWEVAIKEGYPLSSRIQGKKVGDNTVFRVRDDDTEQEFFICLDKQVPANLAHELGLMEDDLFVCRDVALDDTTAANLTLQCRLKTI